MGSDRCGTTAGPAPMLLFLCLIMPVVLGIVLVVRWLARRGMIPPLFRFARPSAPFRPGVRHLMALPPAVAAVYWLNTPFSVYQPRPRAALLFAFDLVYILAIPLVAMSRPLSLVGWLVAATLLDWALLAIAVPLCLLLP